LTKKDKTTQASPKPPEEGAEEKRSLIRHPLHTLGGIIAEACRVYRQMRDNKLDHQQGRSLVWVLAQMRAMVETQALERLEARLEELAPGIEGRGHGQQTANRPSRTAH
jgi:hypothetical protein